MRLDSLSWDEITSKREEAALKLARAASANDKRLIAKYRGEVNAIDAAAHIKAEREGLRIKN